ncbi:MAG: hypothetical protein U0R65_01560 [Candidatus Nanopelagicales bacterium]
MLDRVGLVHASSVGRERRFQVDQEQLARSAAQLAEVGAAWDARLLRIKQLAEDLQRQVDGSRPQPPT